MKRIEQQARPAWRELFYEPEHPWWFEWTSLGQRPPDLAGSSPPEPEESAEQADELGPDIFQQMIALYQQARTQ